MVRTRCAFCGHGNPEGSRFCNACGSPLHLAPCPRCEAVNDVDAKACHRCGAPLPHIHVAASEPLPVPEAFAHSLAAAHAAPEAPIAPASIVVPPDEARLATVRGHAQTARRRRALRTTALALAILVATPMLYAWYFPDSVFGARLQTLYDAIAVALREPAARDGPPAPAAQQPSQ